MKNLCRKIMLVLIGVVVLALTGCVANKMPDPTALQIPTPHYDNNGQYMCPYTQDGVMAEWTDKAVNAKMGAAVGQMAGAYAGQKAFEMVPILGGFLGSTVGEYAGRKIAIEAAGGEEFIRESSDISFDDLNEMSIYMYATHSTHEHYQSALQAAMEIYPDLKKVYTSAIYNAPTR